MTGGVLPLLKEYREAGERVEVAATASIREDWDELEDASSWFCMLARKPWKFIIANHSLAGLRRKPAQITKYRGCRFRRLSRRTVCVQPVECRAFVRRKVIAAFSGFCGASNSEPSREFLLQVVERGNQSKNKRHGEIAVVRWKEVTG